MVPIPRRAPGVFDARAVLAGLDRQAQGAWPIKGRRGLIRNEHLGNHWRRMELLPVGVNDGEEQLIDSPRRGRAQRCDLQHALLDSPWRWHAHGDALSREIEGIRRGRRDLNGDRCAGLQVALC